MRYAIFWLFDQVVKSGPPELVSKIFATFGLIASFSRKAAKTGVR